MGWRATVGLSLSLCSGLAAGPLTAAHPREIDELRDRVERLESELSRLANTVEALTEELESDRRIERNRAAARQRMAADQAIFSDEQLRRIESLYQSAHQDWASAEARESLEQLLQSYPGSNRAGCGLLYLAQWARGAQREEYLRRAIAEYSDSRYGDGVQVGAYARLLLARHYLDSGRESEARGLLKALREGFPDAVDHEGIRLATLAEELAEQALP